MADIAALKARRSDDIAGAIWAARSTTAGSSRPRRWRWRSRAALMLKMRVIPCLDVKDGRVVKGVNFVDLRDAGDPVEQARPMTRAGADELMFLDITASHERPRHALDVVARTAEVCFMPLTVGGGVRDGRGHARAAAGRGRQGLDQHRRRREPGLIVRDAPTPSAASASWWPSTPRRVAAGDWEVFTYGGRNAHRPRRGRMGAADGASTARARSC